MKLEEKNLIVKRAYKSVYKCDDCIVKVFNEGHPKSDVFNEALNTARVEETGLESGQLLLSTKQVRHLRT